MHWKRTPRNYNGVEVTTKEVKDVLTEILPQIKMRREKRPERINELWEEVIGPKLSPMTKVDSFNDGKLIIKVKNSTLHSLLCQYEKEKILKILQDKLSKKMIKELIFKIG